MLCSIWNEAFSDSCDFIENFFKYLPDIGTCIVLEADGNIVAQTVIIEKLNIIQSNHASANRDSQNIIKCAYLYAIAVKKAHQGNGYGKAITEFAVSFAKKRGAETVCLRPGENSLFNFYEKAAGLKPTLHIKTHTGNIPAAHNSSKSGFFVFSKIYADDYNKLREAFLKKQPHMQLQPDHAKLLDIICSGSSGGLYSVFSPSSGFNTSIAIISGYKATPEISVNSVNAIPEKKNTLCEISEILCNLDYVNIFPANIKSQIAYSFAEYLNCNHFLWNEPSDSGQPFLTSSCAFPENTIWNITFE